MRRYIIHVLASLSVMLNTILGGSYRNTFSARCGYEYYIHEKTWAKVAVIVIDTMFFWDENHCYREYVNEFLK